VVGGTVVGDIVVGGMVVGGMVVGDIVVGNTVVGGTVVKDEVDGLGLGLALGARDGLPVGAPDVGATEGTEDGLSLGALDAEGAAVGGYVPKQSPRTSQTRLPYGPSGRYPY